MVDVRANRARHENSLGRYLRHTRAAPARCCCTHAPLHIPAPPASAPCTPPDRPPCSTRLLPPPPPRSHDTALPKWFAEDERKFMRPQAQVRAARRTGCRTGQGGAGEARPALQLAEPLTPCASCLPGLLHPPSPPTQADQQGGVRGGARGAARHRRAAHQEGAPPARPPAAWHLQHGQLPPLPLLLLTQRSGPFRTV